MGVIVLAGLLLWNPLCWLDARVAPASLAASTLVRIDPAERVVDPGETFTLDVVVEDVPELGGYEFKVAYDPAVLEVSAVENGEFLGSTGRSLIPIEPNIDNQAGIVRVATASMGTSSGADGSGTLAVITLTGVGEGISDLDLYDVKLAEPAGGRIETAAGDGRVKVGEGPMPTRVPTEVPTETPTPSATPTEAPAESPTPSAASTEAAGSPTPGATTGAAPTAGPAETDEPSSAATVTATAEEAGEEESSTSATPAPTGEVDTGTPAAAATMTEAAVAEAGSDSSTSATAVPGASEAETEAPDRVPTDADEGPDGTDAPLAARTWLIVAAALLASAGVAVIAVGVLVFRRRETSEDA